MKVSPPAQVLVFGSLNMDLVVRVPRVPEAGETLTAHAFVANPGGKGANQALACARQGARVSMVGCVGTDSFGASLRTALETDGVDASGVRTVAGSSGIAMIMVDEQARNRIAVVPAANAALCVDDAQALREQLACAQFLIMQLEVPVAAVLRAAELARALGCKVLLNPAPAQTLPDELWPLVDLLVVNETEAAMLSGLALVTSFNASEVAQALRARGPAQVIITLGRDGLVWTDEQLVHRLAAYPVDAVDTTAAGDTFIGALCAALVEGRAMEEALHYAVRAAAVCVTRYGAQSSIPWRADVDALS